MLYPLSRALLFRLEPEKAHALALKALTGLGGTPGLRTVVASRFREKADPVELFGVRFPNRVGLAAGYDKDGKGWRGLSCLGFGHIEVGTVTPKPQPGNPRPRVFRLPEHGSLINRMGFPGEGADAVAARLSGTRPGGVVLGVNIGKQKTTALEDAGRDYAVLMEVFAPHADYLAVNISSPNTPGLRKLQERDFLEGLLGGLAEKKRSLEDGLGRRVPVLVKLAPDLQDDQLDTAVDAIVASDLDGVIATNTTIGRDGVEWHARAGEEGGLSGAALTGLATEIIAKIARRLGGALPLIGVGGIMNPQDALDKLEVGADLVQVYTGLVYRGPSLVAEILRAIADRRS